jgi:hypothetical protein
MAMIEKSLVIIIFMYASSFAALGMQYTLADSFGINLQGANGDDISSEVVDLIRIGEINTRTTNATSQSVEDSKNWIIYNPITAAAGLVWEIFLLLTGTYVFNLLFYVLGIPAIWITGFVVLYFFLLMRTIVAYLRGI